MNWTRFKLANSMRKLVHQSIELIENDGQREQQRRAVIVTSISPFRA